MNFNFSVDMSKKIKRENGMGEDAPPVSKEGILIVCDGTGATGQSKHEYNGIEYTSAYLGSRKTSELVGNFLFDNYEKIIDTIKSPTELKSLITELGNKVRNGLCAFVDENNFKLTVRGRSFRLLPTTLAAAIYKIYDDHIDIVALSAGDSRVLMWEPNDGLHQLSLDDVDSGYDAFSDVSNTNNCISADNNFKINYVVHTISSTKCILFATSDGFTDPIKPFDQERYMIQWLGNCDCVLDKDKSNLTEFIANSLDNDRAGFTGKDDCSIAGVIIGYESDKELKDSLRNRFNYVANTFSVPYRDLDRKCKEAMDEYNSVGGEKRRYVEQINARIRAKLDESVSLLLPANYARNQIVYDFLASQACINSEIRKLNVEYEERLKKAQEKLEQVNKDVRESFIVFLKHYCFVAARNGNNSGLPPEIVWHLDNHVKSSLNKKNVYDAYNSVLRKFKSLPELNFNNNSVFSVEQVTSLCNEIVNVSNEIARLNNAVEESDRIINNFFSLDNVKIIEMFEMHKRNNFVEFDRYIESLKPSRGIFENIFKGKEDDADYQQLRCSKNEFDNIYNKAKRAQMDLDSIKITDSERLQRYKTVVRNNINELVNAIMNNETVFAYFAGEEKAAFDAKIIASEQTSEKAKSLIELKNELWRKYKPAYEMFAIAEKDYVIVPKKSEG